MLVIAIVAIASTAKPKALAAPQAPGDPWPKVEDGPDEVMNRWIGEWKAKVQLLLAQTIAFVQWADNNTALPKHVRDKVPQEVWRTLHYLHGSAQQLWHHMEPEDPDANKADPYYDWTKSEDSWADATAWLDARHKQMATGSFFWVVGDPANQGVLDISGTLAVVAESWKTTLFIWADLVCQFDPNSLTRVDQCELLKRAQAEPDNARQLLRQVVAGGLPVYGGPPQ